MKVNKGGILGFHLLQQGNTQSDPKPRSQIILWSLRGPR